MQPGRWRNITKSIVIVRITAFSICLNEYVNYEMNNEIQNSK